MSLQQTPEVTCCLHDCFIMPLQQMRLKLDVFRLSVRLCVCVSVGAWFAVEF